MNMKGLILIYPLRGTNERRETLGSLYSLHLSPTGDERTETRNHRLTLSVFIPYGGRTNVRQDVSISRKRIYPLRGTNEQRIQPHQLLFLHLSPTGDEQTLRRHLLAFSEIFIPYGGRTNFTTCFGKKYGLHLSPTGDEQTY